MPTLSFQHLYISYDAAHRPPEPERTLSAMELFNKRRKVTRQIGRASCRERV